MSTSTADTPADDPVLREALKRCSPATYYAACKFRASRDSAHLRTVVLGVLERFAERELRAKLAGAPAAVDALRLSEDLALDSLTMMEVVMLAEEVLSISVANEELSELRTVGAVQSFLARKTASIDLGKPASKDASAEVLHHATLHPISHQPANAA